MSSVLIKSFPPNDNDDKDNICIALNISTALHESHNLRASLIIFIMLMKKILRFREVQSKVMDWQVIELDRDSRSSAANSILFLSSFSYNRFFH